MVQLPNLLISMTPASHPIFKFSWLGFWQSDVVRQHVTRLVCLKQVEAFKVEGEFLIFCMFPSVGVSKLVASQNSVGLVCLLWLAVRGKSIVMEH